MEPEIVEKGALKVVGMHTKFIHALSPDANGHEIIGPLWGAFGPHMPTIPNRVGADVSHGVMYAEEEKSHPDELHYIAGVPVSSFDDVPEGMVTREIPAGTYAVFTLKGPLTQFGRWCEQMYREWLPASAYEHGGGEDLEQYDERFCFDDPEVSVQEYWISVRPK